MDSIKHKMACLIKERSETMERALKLEAEKKKSKDHANEVDVYKMLKPDFKIY